MNQYTYTVNKVDEETKTMEVLYVLGEKEILVSMPLPTTSITLEDRIKSYIPNFNNNDAGDFVTVQEGTNGSNFFSAINDAEFNTVLKSVLESIPKAEIESINKILEVDRKYIKTIPYYSHKGTLIGIEFSMPAEENISSAFGAVLLLEAKRIVDYAKSLGVFCIAVNAKQGSEDFFKNYPGAIILKRIDGYRVIYSVWDETMETNKLNELKNIVRNKRNRLLLETDYVFNPDVNIADSTPWIEYRQALRDITDQEGFPKNVIWPTPP